MTELNAGKKEAGPVVALAEVGAGRNGHYLARTSCTTTTPIPRGLGHPPAGSGMPAFYSLVAYKCSGEGGGPPPDLL